MLTDGQIMSRYMYLSTNNTEITLSTDADILVSFSLMNDGQARNLTKTLQNTNENYSRPDGEDGGYDATSQILSPQNMLTKFPPVNPKLKTM